MGPHGCRSGSVVDALPRDAARGQSTTTAGSVLGLEDGDAPARLPDRSQLGVLRSDDTSGRTGAVCVSRASLASDGAGLEQRHVEAGPPPRDSTTAVDRQVRNGPPQPAWSSDGVAVSARSRQRQEVTAVNDVHDVAAAILAELGAMDTMKLRKLVYYYSQAWHLAVIDEPLFDEPVGAWAQGPVVDAVYRQHRGMRRVQSWPARRSDRFAGGQPSHREPRVSCLRQPVRR